MSACAGKRAYLTEMDAIGSALHSSRKRGVALRYYRCPSCGWWHLTKLPRFDRHPTKPEEDPYLRATDPREEHQ